MASTYACQRLGYSRTADLVGQSIFSLVATSDRDRFATTLPSEPTDSVQGEAEFPVVVGNICLRVLPSDGSTIWVKTRCRWVSDRDRVSQLMLVWEEIGSSEPTVAGGESPSLSKGESSQTANEGQKIQDIADALPVGISYVDVQQRYRYANQTYKRWFQLSGQQIYSNEREIPG